MEPQQAPADEADRNETDHAVAAKDTFMHVSPESSLLDVFSHKYAISKREQQVLQRILEGDDTVTISRKLCISENTTKTHVRQLFRKTETHNRVGLAAKFFQENR